MSEMEWRRGKLKAVMHYGKPVTDVQDYIESEYSLHPKGQVDNETALGILREVSVGEGWKLNYFLVGDKLYKLVSEEDVGPCGHVEAKWTGFQEIEVDCHWYNGGASWREVVEEAVNKLEK